MGAMWNLCQSRHAVVGKGDAMNTFELVVGVLLVLMTCVAGVCATGWRRWIDRARYAKHMEGLWYKYYCEEGSREHVCPNCKNHFFPCEEEDAREGLGKEMP